MSNRPERSSSAQGEVASTVLLQFSRKEMITWHEMRQFQQPHHYIVWQWRFYPIVQTCKKWVMTLSSSMAMYSVIAWHTWCKKCTNGKRMSCSLLICHTQIFKSIVFRTMSLLNMDYLFFFDTHLYKTHVFMAYGTPTLVTLVYIIIMGLTRSIRDSETSKHRLCTAIVYPVPVENGLSLHFWNRMWRR